MGATHDDTSDAVNISAQVDKELPNDSDRALRQAQLDEVVPLDMSQAETLRRLMRLVVDNSSMIAGVGKGDNSEQN